jgi:uncharacterized protein (DUF849 family)
MLIKACLNGGRTRDEHPAVPLTSAELAKSAREARDAGAAAIHIHPREASGAQTLEAGPVHSAVAAVRAATGLPVGVSTGLWIVNGDTDRRLALVAEWNGPDRPDFATINLNEPGADALADLLTDLGIPIEAGVWTADDARLLAASTFADRIIRVLIEPVDRVPADAVATALEASAELAGLGIDTPQVHHGFGPATWDVIRAAVGRDCGIRVGLEDTTVLPDGTIAAGNGDLVAAAVRLAQSG